MGDSPQKDRSWLDIVVALTPLLLGVLVTGVGAAFTQVYNYRQLQLNQLAALDKFRPLLISEKADEREFAYASFAALGYEKLALKMIALKQDGAGRAVAQDISTSGDTGARSAASAVLATIPAQVYLHIGSEALRPLGDAVAKELAARGLQPMGIENVEATTGVPERTQVRYFNDADKVVADAVVTALGARGIEVAASSHLAGLKARPGTVEIWLGRDVSPP